MIYWGSFSSGEKIIKFEPLNSLSKLSWGLPSTTQTSMFSKLSTSAYSQKNISELKEKSDALLTSLLLTSISASCDSFLICTCGSRFALLAFFCHWLIRISECHSLNTSKVEYFCLIPVYSSNCYLLFNKSILKFGWCRVITKIWWWKQLNLMEACSKLKLCSFSLLLVC